MVKKKWAAGKNTRQRVMTCRWLAVISTEGKAHSPCVLSIFICNIKRLYCYQSFSNFLIFFVSEFFVLKSCMEYGYINKRPAVIKKVKIVMKRGQTPFHLLTLPLHHQHIYETLPQSIVWKHFILRAIACDWWSRVCALESSICSFQYGLHHLNRPLKLCMPQFPCLTSEDDK